MSQWFMAEFVCRDCGWRYESLEKRSATAKTLSQPPCGCAAVADRVLSAPRVGTVWGYAATRGANDTAPTPDYLDTERLADDGDYDAFKGRQRAFQRDRRRAQVKRDVG